MRCNQKCQDGSTCSRLASKGRKCWQHTGGQRSRSRIKSKQRGGGRKNGTSCQQPNFPMPEASGWTVYGWNTCGYTQKSLSLLNKAGQDVTFYDISGCMEPANKALAKKTGSYTKVPRVFNNGTYVKGGSEGVTATLIKLGLMKD